jgi:hypothetical protein
MPTYNTGKSKRDPAVRKSRPLSGELDLGWQSEYFFQG